MSATGNEEKAGFLEKIKNNLWTYDLNNYRNMMGYEIQPSSTIYILKAFFLDKIKNDDAKNNIKIAKLYSYLGLIYVRLGMYEDAKESFITELDYLYNEKKSISLLPLLKMVNHINLGNIYYYMNETMAALMCYKFSFSLLEKMATMSNVGSAINLADTFFPLVCCNLGQLSEVLTHHENALAFYNISNEWYNTRLPKDVNMLSKNGFNIVRLLIKSKQYNAVGGQCQQINKCLREKMYFKKLNYHLFNWDRDEQTGQYSEDTTSEEEESKDEVKLKKKHEHPYIQKFLSVLKIKKSKKKI